MQVLNQKYFNLFYIQIIYHIQYVHLCGLGKLRVTQNFYYSINLFGIKSNNLTNLAI
jgi:hypothetical protein